MADSSHETISHDALENDVVSFVCDCDFHQPMDSRDGCGSLVGCSSKHGSGRSMGAYSIGLSDFPMSNVSALNKKKKN